MNAYRVAHGLVIAAALGATLSSCGGGGSSATIQSTPVPTPLPSVSPPAHMYVEYGSAAGHTLVEYHLPLNASSVPDAVLAKDTFINQNPYAVDPSSGTLAIGPGADDFPTDGLKIYRPALKPGQNPAVIIPTGPATLPNAVTAAAFDPLGNLWVSTQVDLREFPLPFANTEVASTVQSNYSFFNLEVAPNGALWGIANPLAVFAPLDPPLSFAYTQPAKKIGGMVQFVTPLVFDQYNNAIAGYQIVATGPSPLPAPFPVPTAGLGVFPLPLTPDSLPSTVIPLPGSGQIQPSLDGSIGTDQFNVYVGDSQDGSIYVYPLPFSNTAPAFRLPCPASLAPCTLPGLNLPNAVFQYGP